MKTFPLVDYHVIKEIHEKCTQIVSDLENMIPEGTKLEDIVHTHREESFEKGSFKVLHFSSYARGGITGYDENSGTVHYNLYSRKLKDVKKVTIDEYIRLSTETRYFIVLSSLDKPHLSTNPSNKYHRTVYIAAKTILGQLKTDKPVNPLSLELSAALKFLEELNDGEWKQGLITPCHEEISKAIKEKVTSYTIKTKKAIDQRYENEVNEFKQDLKRYSIPTKNKPIEKPTEKICELSLWQKLVSKIF